MKSSVYKLVLYDGSGKIVYTYTYGVMGLESKVGKDIEAIRGTALMMLKEAKWQERKAAA